MASPEIRVGTQNKLIPYDIKVGIACTYLMGEGMVKAAKPIVPVVSMNIERRLERNRQRRMHYMEQHRGRARST